MSEEVVQAPDEDTLADLKNQVDLIIAAAEELREFQGSAFDRAVKADKLERRLGRGGAMLSDLGKYARKQRGERRLTRSVIFEDATA